MSNYKGEVIKYLRRKEDGSLNSPISWLGAEQCFVGALRGSNLNNLEEQSLLGPDTYTLFYKDANDNEIIEKHYCATNTSSVADKKNYYKVISTIYKIPIPQGDSFLFNNDKLILGNSVGAQFGESGTDYSDVNGIYFSNNSIVEFDGTKLKSYPNTRFIERMDELFFVRSDFSDLAVATKYTSTEYTMDGKKIVLEHIINMLR